MLIIRRDLVDAMVAHAKADHPVEACGIIAGPIGSDRPEHHIAMHNAENSTVLYRFDTDEQLTIWRALDDMDFHPVVVYHSHTASDPWPSRTDIEYACEPDAHYVIIDTRTPCVTVCSYRIIDGTVISEAVEAVDSYEAA